MLTKKWWSVLCIEGDGDTFCIDVEARTAVGAVMIAGELLDPGQSIALAWPRIIPTPDVLHNAHVLDYYAMTEPF